MERGGARSEWKRSGSAAGGSPLLARNVDGRWKHLLLHREDWKPQDCEGPLIGIGFEWNPSQHGFEQGYIGMRIDLSIEGVDSLRASIVEGLGAVAEVAGFRKTPYWPAYRYVEPFRASYWEDLDMFAAEITEAVGNLWNCTWEVADKAFQDWAREGLAALSSP